MLIRKTAIALLPAALLLGTLSTATFAHSEESFHAALLSAGTADAGIGPSGQVGEGIAAVGTQRAPEVAGVQTAGAEDPYVAGLRLWTSAGYRVEPGHVHLFALDRGDDVAGNAVEVAGVQVLGVAEPAAYEMAIRVFSSNGYRVQAGWVPTASIARR